jgi:1,2-phenylacetyl-CoA epoxidase PaaB subunit
MPRKALLTWELYLARSTPAKYIGSVEAADAEAAIEAATKEFEVKDPKRLIAVARSASGSILYDSVPTMEASK